MESSSIGAIAVTRFQALRAQHDNQHTTNETVAMQPTIDHTQKQPEENNNTSIELPSAIKNLITGNDFWVTAKTNRYKKLVREGHLSNLLELAKLALTKNNPANWFAKVCSVKAWERTLDFLKKLHNVQKKAEGIIKRIGEGVEKLVYKHIWAGRSVERHAVAAQEIGKDRHKLFAWLCKQEEQGTAATNTV